MFLPSEICARAYMMASSTITLPAVLATISSASRMGTPDDEQRAERAREARDGDLAEDVAHDGQRRGACGRRLLAARASGRRRRRRRRPR